MEPIPRPELKNAPLNCMVEASLKAKVVQYAKQNGVSNSEAVRFILQKFFGTHIEKIEVHHDEFVVGEGNGTENVGN